MGVVPPERLTVDELLVRRWQRDDLTARHQAVVASYAELHAWMEWLPGPATVAQQQAFTDRCETGWPDVTGEFGYGIFDGDGGVVLGALGLRRKTEPDALWLGYWRRTGHGGRGLVTRAAAALTDIALGLPTVRQVWIRCDVANARSAAVARRLGFRLDRVLQDSVRTPAEAGASMYWVRS